MGSATMAPLRFMRGSQLVLIWSSYGGRGLHGFLGWEGEPNVSKKKGKRKVQIHYGKVVLRLENFDLLS